MVRHANDVVKGKTSQYGNPLLRLQNQQKRKAFLKM